jgi:hypothetical protein
VARTKEPQPNTFIVAMPPDQLAGYLSHQFSGYGAIVNSQSAIGVTGQLTTKQKPSWLVAVLLWFICIIPMIIYLINHSKDVADPFSLTFTPQGAGTRVDVSGQGRGAAMARYVLDQMGATAVLPSGAVLDVEATYDDHPEAEAAWGAPSGPAVPPPGHSPFAQSAGAGRWDQQPAEPAGTAPSGWYPDPLDQVRIRYWNAGEWTQHVAAAPGWPSGGSGGGSAWPAPAIDQRNTSIPPIPGGGRPGSA